MKVRFAVHIIVALQFVTNVAHSQEWAVSLIRGAKLKQNQITEIGKDALADANKEFLSIKVGQQRNGTYSNRCPPCIQKDYSEPCPMHWLDIRVEGYCQAPREYDGICNNKQTFLGSTAADKEEAETTCLFCWPCKAALQSNSARDESTCERDWGVPCPFGYTAIDIPYDQYQEASGMKCKAVAGYNGPCELEVAFSLENDKQLFSERCATDWPCKDICHYSIGRAICPEDWLHIGAGNCVAPDYYKVSGCPLLENLQGWSIDMKVKFANDCKVRWPCGISTGSGVSCKKVKMTRCPLGWVSELEYCVPPIGSEGYCNKLVALGKMNVDEKMIWAQACDVQWPCEQESGQLDPTNSIGFVDALQSGAINETGFIIT